MRHVKKIEVILNTPDGLVPVIGYTVPALFGPNPSRGVLRVYEDRALWFEQDDPFDGGVITEHALMSAELDGYIVEHLLGPGSWLHAVSLAGEPAMWIA